MSSSEPQQALDAIPVFPLPGMTLFPHTHLPLHIFEPRYRALMEDTLAQPEAKHVFAMGTLLESPNEHTLGDPPVHRVAGVGRIVEYSRMPDGRYMLVLQGIGRARLGIEKPQVNGYRVFDAQWLSDINPPWKGRWNRELAAELKTLALALLRDQAERLRRLLADEEELSRLTDLLCGYLPFAPEFKLEQMGCTNVVERAARTIAQLETRLVPGPNKPLRPDQPASLN
jgi:Lon protease-like protein